MKIRKKTEKIRENKTVIYIRNVGLWKLSLAAQRELQISADLPLEQNRNRDKKDFFMWKFGFLPCFVLCEMT